MSFLGKIVPLILLCIGLGVAAFIGYAAYTIATDIAEKTSKKMEQKHVSFGKDGMKIGIREVKTENYVDQTQRYTSFSYPKWDPVMLAVAAALPLRDQRRELHTDLLAVDGHA